ncbi:hypothetical protein ABZ734_02205 [Streptomyces sp. NPDC006660]|uniref:hypothetical protein n=1 Tax=Streptomyces sp. NPDC006660 TaxID=3156901 RepID=UPI0033C9B69B
MKPRLLPDTRLLPSDRGVVISGPRHTATFAQPGIYPWLERLRPYLDGRTTLDQLTAGLPPQAAHHVRALVELLTREGFVRDATADLPHGLGPGTRARHAALIDFIAARADSPEHRFERYRDCAPLVVGSGQLAGALVLALLASGVAHVRLRLDERPGSAEASTDVDRLRACVALLKEEGGSFHYEQLSAGSGELPSGVGVLLLGSDVFDPSTAGPARALARRAGIPYGQVVGQGGHVVISAVGTPGPAGADAPPGGGNGQHTTARPARAKDPADVDEPSPYLGGPVAALAANQLCLHLLHRVGGLDAVAESSGPAHPLRAAVLDPVTARFLGAESP